MSGVRESKKLSVCISHAWEDQAAVNLLYKHLIDDDFAPWRCELSVRGGSDWREKLKKSLKTSDIFLFCISRHSTTRDGLFRRELEDALDILQEKGEESFSIVLLRLDESDIPQPLQSLMAIDLFAPDSYQQLLEVLRNRIAQTSRVVFSLHGIGTRGKWQKDVVPLLNQAGFTVVPFDYGYFLAAQLLLAGSRAKKIDWFRDEYTRQCNRTSCNRPSIIAHSLGSYLVAQAMDKYPQIRFDRIILCGAIVRRKFPWKELGDGGQVRTLLNQYGGNDRWTRVVEWVVSDTGPSGRNGFDSANQYLIQQKHPRFGHSDYFYDLNYQQNWIPFLLGKAIGPANRESSQGWNRKFLITRTVLLLVILVLAVYGYRWWKGQQSISRRKQVQVATPTSNQTSTGPQSPNINGVSGPVNVHYGDHPTTRTDTPQEKKP